MSQNHCSVFNDPVHGYIELHPLLVNIIHTPQFQRLKDIKQLGATYWVYPGASHNRFEHSLGTAFLAGKMIEILRDVHKGEIEITPEEVLCVKIAALCHDIGHGPFSHVFDTQVKEKLLKLHPSNQKLRDWKHEDASCKMFDHMLKVNDNLKNAFEENKIGEDEQELIKELIKGKEPGQDVVHQMADFKGTSYPKWFLFEIVANKRNGIDCDKFDYFARDCLNLGVKSNFDHTRYLQNIRILPVDNQLQICARDKLVFNIYELFHTRWSLHHRVYQHKTTKAIEDMISEAFVLVDHKFHFANAISNMADYTTLTDSILYEIIRCKDTDDNVKEAKKIIQRIQCRDLYKFCGETQPSTKIEVGALEISEEIVSFDDDVAVEDIFVLVVEIHFGMKHNDPIESVVFYNKDLNKATQLRKNVVSEMLPQKFTEQYIRAYAKKSDKKDQIEKCFHKWCQSCHFPYPNQLTGDKTGYFTPAKSKQDTVGKRTRGEQGGDPKRARKELFGEGKSTKDELA